MSRKEKILELAQKLIEIESHYLHKYGENKVGELLSEYVNKDGFNIFLQEVKDERKNIHITYDTRIEGPSLLFCGHMDTVRGDGMTGEPFKGIVSDNKLFGRGSVDMKGAISSMINAIVEANRNNYIKSGKISFIGTIGEESPDCSEGGYALRNLDNLCDFAIIGEATDLKIGIAHKGTCGIRVNFKGKAAHGSTPKLGDNAILKAVKSISYIEDILIKQISKKSHLICGKPSLNIGKIGGGMQNNIVPDNAFFSYDRRYLPGEKIEDLINEIRDAIIGAGISENDFEILIEEETKYRGPMETSKDSLIVKEMIKACQINNISGEIVGLDYWTDGSHLSSNGIETIVCGPGNIAQAHSACEYISLDSLYKSYDIYLTLIKNMMN